MKKTLNIIVEGQTERDFVTQCMMPYFADRNIFNKRLEQLITPQYIKPFHGNYIALTNSFEAILEKCPRFKHWVNTLLDAMSV